MSKFDKCPAFDLDLTGLDQFTIDRVFSHLTKLGLVEISGNPKPRNGAVDSDGSKVVVYGILGTFNVFSRKLHGDAYNVCGYPDNAITLKQFFDLQLHLVRPKPFFTRTNDFLDEAIVKIQKIGLPITSISSYSDYIVFNGSSFAFVQEEDFDLTRSGLSPSHEIWYDVFLELPDSHFTSRKEIR